MARTRPSDILSRTASLMNVVIDEAAHWEDAAYVLVPPTSTPRRRRGAL